jgi:Ca2+-binding RTX toxin-like protein
MSCKPHAPIYGQEGDFIDDSLETGNLLSDAVGGFIGGEGSSPGKAFGHLGHALELAQAVYREGLDYSTVIKWGVIILATGAIMGSLGLPAAAVTFITSFSATAGLGGEALGYIVTAMLSGYVGSALNDVLTPIENYVNDNRDCPPNSMMEEMQHQYGNREVDPIVLDLNNDGKFSFLHPDSSTVFFDFDGNGFAEQTGWAALGDGYLAMDLDGNGRISDVSELFSQGLLFAGYSIVGIYDSNQDSLIDNRDTSYNSFRIWVDANHNGYSEASELRTLAQAGIKSINLTHTLTDVNNNGNHIAATSTFTYTNGVIGKTAAVGLGVNQYNSQKVVGSNFSYDPDVFGLPQLTGYGLAPDLWKAMSMNSALKLTVENLVNQNFSTYSITAFRSSMETMLFQWLGVSGVPASYGGGAMDGRKLAALEVLESLSYGDINGQVTAAAGVNLTNMWDSFVNQETYKFLLQIPRLAMTEAEHKAYDTLETHFERGGADLSDSQLQTMINPIFSAALATAKNHPLYNAFPGIIYNLQDDTLLGDFSGRLKAALDNAPTGSALPAYWQKEQILVDALAKGGGYLAPLVSLKTTPLIGTTGADTINGTDTDTILYGKSGNDKLTGGEGDDVLMGGTNNDTLKGGGGADTYIWSIGDGNDTIDNNYGINYGDVIKDKILFGTGIAPTDVKLSRSGTDLVISVLNGQGTLRVLNHLSPYSDAVFKEIDEIGFADGSGWDITKIKEILTAPTSGNDTITGFYTDDVLTGAAGNDWLDGGLGNDTLLGGDGNDTFIGEGGIDSYDGGNGTDTLDLRPFGSSSSICTTDLVNGLRYSGGNIQGGDRLLAIENVIANDGPNQMIGNTANNNFTGAGWNDTLSGGSGNDTLNGGNGNDSIDGGSGDDTLLGSAGTDTLNGGAGNDRYIYNTGTNTVVEAANEGTDTVETSNSNITLGANVENLLITGSTNLNGAGNALSNAMTGNAGSNTLWGNEGNDSLSGGAGNDTLYGWTGNDTLDGGDGADLVQGENDQDSLNGGNGDDTVNGASITASATWSR